MRTGALQIVMAILLIALVGCASPASRSSGEDRAPGAQQARPAADEEELRAEIERLTKETRVVTQEVQQLRELVSRLQAELNARTREATLVPDSLIDPRYANLPGGTEGWAYRKTAEGDLDGDGTAETVRVITSAEIDPATHRVAWDDGHPWHVYIDEPDGTRTLVFARWVQLGRLTVMIGEDPKGVIIQQSGSMGTTIWQVDYRGPDQVESSRLARVQVRKYASFPEGEYYEE